MPSRRRMPLHWEPDGLLLPAHWQTVIVRTANIFSLVLIFLRASPYLDLVTLLPQSDGCCQPSDASAHNENSQGLIVNTIGAIDRLDAIDVALGRSHDYFDG